MRSANPAEQGRDKRSQRANVAGFPPSGTPDAFPAQLAGHHLRRESVEHRGGLQDRFPAEAIPTQTTPSNCFHKGGGGVHADRDSKHAGQTGHLRDKSEPRGLLLPAVSGSQKGRQAEACHKSEKAEPVSGT